MRGWSTWKVFVIPVDTGMLPVRKGTTFTCPGEGEWEAKVRAANELGLDPKDIKVELVDL